MFRRGSALAFTMLCTLNLGCNDGQGPPEITGLEYGGGEFEQRINSSGFPRLYLVYIPSTISASTAAPLLIAFHGSDQPPRSMRDMTGFNELAEERGWIVVYPLASVGRWTVNPDTYPASEGYDDVDFTDRMIDRIDEDLNIDRDRVYAAGYSNGALMTHRLACSLPDRIAAIASVGATMTFRVGNRCEFTRPVPSILFLGDQDQEFPWEGVVTPFDGGYSAEETAAWFAEMNGCPDERDDTQLEDATEDGTTVERWRYDQCPQDATVDFYAIYGGGHTWPGSPVTPNQALGTLSRDIDASETILDFFEAHPMR